MVRTLAFLLALSAPGLCNGSGAFLFATETVPERVTHPIGYDGTGGVVEITVGIRPGSLYAAEMVNPTLNAIETFNRLDGRLPNLFKSSPEIPVGHHDFESVLVHEIGHAVGLAHANIGYVAGFTNSTQMSYAQSTAGPNGEFELFPGIDRIIGSSDDVRGDDVPLLWFSKLTNDPFSIVDPADATTYSVFKSDLPFGNIYPAYGSEPLSTRLGYQLSETIMKQGAGAQEIQRELTPGDEAILRLAAAGVDRIAGTSDDYVMRMRFVGFDENADIPIGFNNSKAVFASTWLEAELIDDRNAVLTLSEVFFNSTYKWHFNQVRNFPGAPKDKRGRPADIPLRRVTESEEALR